MKTSFIRIILYIILGIIAFFPTKNYLEKKYPNDLEKNIAQTIFVDQNKNNELKTGSINYPFQTIQEALNKRNEKSLEKNWTIIISNGEYQEVLIIPKNTTLIGEINKEKKVNINNPNIEISNTITVSNNTNLINLNINNGHIGIYIPFNTATKIINTNISNCSKYGLKMEATENREYYENEIAKEVILNKTKKELEKLPLVRISHSIIQSSRKQGLYLKDGHIEIENSKIINNGEEGIDFHPHMYAKIKNNEIISNGESGVESEIEDNILIIENNKIENNLRSGIALLTAEGIGEITIKNNSIKNNERFGIRCARHKSPPKKVRPFFSSVIKHKDNVIKNNTEGDFSLDCSNF
ncbi:MAG: right-handed parallel beta-helix repeat-containing protein [Candidatus Moranbacteria bacterium]|nr:right-handed parallel beta-helix repeat-containing protein [Candidatus Moranbacteria bacterium]